MCVESTGRVALQRAPQRIRSWLTLGADILSCVIIMTSRNVPECLKANDIMTADWISIPTTTTFPDCQFSSVCGWCGSGRQRGGDWVPFAPPATRDDLVQAVNTWHTVVQIFVSLHYHSMCDCYTVGDRWMQIGRFELMFPAWQAVPVVGENSCCFMSSLRWFYCRMQQARGFLVQPVLQPQQDGLWLFTRTMLYIYIYI